MCYDCDIVSFSKPNFTKYSRLKLYRKHFFALLNWSPYKSVNRKYVNDVNPKKLKDFTRNVFHFTHLKTLYKSITHIIFLLNDS